MSLDPESVRARRYLLGETTDDEAVVIEQEYFEREDAVDRISAAEDELIEEYLDGRLALADRDRFERVYMSVPHRARRVETVRRLIRHAARPGELPRGQVVVFPQRRVPGRVKWIALAASLLLVAALARWALAPDRIEAPRVARTSPPAAPSVPAPTPPATVTPPASTDPAPRTPLEVPSVFAVTLSPVSVRSGADGPNVVVPAGTDTIAIRLEGEADGRELTPHEASIRTVAGSDVWKGRVITERRAAPGTIARVNVPASRLPADDYVVTLFGTGRDGAAQEWAQYVLRIRAP